MQVVGGGPFIYTLILTSLTVWGGLASTASNTLPSPTLSIKQRLKDSVVLVCRAPEGQHGVVFMLYKVTEKVDTQAPQSDAEEVQFTVRMKDLGSDRTNLFCCLFKNPEGFYSAFSPYLQLENPIDDPPTRPIPPVLSVEPSPGAVRPGETLSFRCTVPAHLPQSQSQSNKPMTFLLLRMEEPTEVMSVVLHTRASQEANLNQNLESQQGAFTVGPMKGGEQGKYACIYQTHKRRGLVNSTVSNVIQVNIADLLPNPTLVLQQQTDVWHLQCTGSAAYPGAVFSLYLADKELPVATQHARVFQHHATFPIPVQDTLVALYQCQYSVLLGSKWSDSERSLSLAVTKGIPSPSSSGVDWPLVLGSISAVVLFLSSLAVVIVMAHRKVKAAAKEKKKREEAQFWIQVHDKDHIVDLTLRRTSFTSQEWPSGEPATASRSPLWNSHFTFTTPAY